MKLIFKDAECHFITITSVPTTKIDCKSIVSTLMKDPIIHDNKPNVRSKSTDTFIKKEIVLNLFENLLALYIRVRTYSFAKGQIQSNKIKISRLNSRSLWTSLNKMDFENCRVSLTIEWAIFMAINNGKMKIAALFFLVLIKIRRKKQVKLFWSLCLYLLFFKSVKFLNSIASHNKQHQVRNKHEWTHGKYLNIFHNIFHQSRTQKTLQYVFFNVLQKYSKHFISGTLIMSGHFHQKLYCQLVETLIFICMEKMNSIPNFFFEILWSYCKLVISSTFRILDVDHKYW